MGYFTRYFKAYFNVGTVEQPASGSLPSRRGLKRAKDWLRRQIERELAKAFPKRKKPKRVIEVLSLPEPRKTLRLNVKRTERPLDLEKILKRQEQKQQVFAAIERKVEDDLLELFEVEQDKIRKRKAKRLKEEEFLLFHL